MSNIYLDKERHDMFQQKQDELQNSIQSTAENYTNELLQSKLADIQNKTIGSELLFSTIPAGIGKATETYSRIKDVYNKLKVVKGQISDKVDDIRDKVSNLTGAKLDDTVNQPGDKLFMNPLFEDDDKSVSDMRQGLTDRVNAFHDANPEIGEESRSINLNMIENLSDTQVPIVSKSFEGVDMDKSMSPEAGQQLKENLSNETFGNVSDYTGRQLSDIPTAVLPTEDTIGSLKTAITAPIQDTIDAIKAPILDATSAVSDVANKAISGVSDLAAEGTSILAEAAVPIVGDIAAVGSLIFGGVEAFKDLFSKPEAPPVPTINVEAGGVNQAGI